MRRQNPFGWKPKTGLEIHEAEFPPVEWLVEPFIARGEIHVLVGDGGTGKSYVQLDISVGLALEQDVLTGFKVAKGGGRVLYIDQDSGGTQTQRRWKELVRARKVRDEKALERFVLLDEDNIQLDNTESAEKMEDLIGRFKPDLVIFDALRAFHHSEENSSTVIAGVFRLVLRPLVRKHNISVLISHHTNKTSRNSFGEVIQKSASEAARGTTEIRNAADAMSLLTLHPRDPSIRVFELDKTRNLFDEEKPGALTFKAERKDGKTRLYYVDAPAGRLGPKPVEIAKEEVLAVLACGARKAGELQEELPGLQKGSYSRRTLGTALKTLSEEERIFWAKEGKTTVYGLREGK